MFNFEKRPEPQDHPNFLNKGKKGLRCNRTACEHTEAYYWNHVTQAYYCQGCAMRINASCQQSQMDNICKLSEEDKKDWNEHRGFRTDGN